MNQTIDAKLKDIQNAPSYNQYTCLYESKGHDHSQFGTLVDRRSA